MVFKEVAKTEDDDSYERDAEARRFRRNVRSADPLLYLLLRGTRRNDRHDAELLAGWLLELFAAADAGRQSVRFERSRKDLADVLGTSTAPDLLERRRLIAARNLDTEPLRTLTEVLERQSEQAVYASLDELLSATAQRADPLAATWTAFFRAEGEAPLRLARVLTRGLVLARWTEQLPADLARGVLRVPAEELTAIGLDLLGFVRSGWRAEATPAVAAQIEEARRLIARGWPAVQVLGRWRGRLLAVWLGARVRRLQRTERRLARGSHQSRWKRRAAALPRAVSAFVAALAALVVPRAPRSLRHVPTLRVTR